MKTLPSKILPIALFLGAACTAKFRSGGEDQRDPVVPSGGGAGGDSMSSTADSGASGESGANTDGSASDCDDECSARDLSCTDGTLTSCELDEHGCYHIVTTACASGDCSDATSCSSCDHQCDSGATECQAGQIRSCEADVEGCFVWSEDIDCGSGFCASTTACGDCNDECSSGQTECNAGELSSCQADDEGCMRWSAPTACSTNLCDGDACFVCDHQCASGSFDCDGSTLRECTSDSMGCRVWSEVQDCTGREPICMASEGRCACDAATPLVCQDSDTPETCVDGTWTVQADCAGTAPRCIDGIGCQPCTENSDCPASGCHFLGPDQGACFDTADVLDVSDAAELEDTVTNLGSNAQAIIMLAAGTYDIDPFVIQNGQEVSLVGEPGTIITRSATGADPNTMSLSFDSYLYLSNLTIANGAGARAVGAAQGGSVWIEDIVTYGYAYGIYGPGDKYIRRSRIAGTIAGIGAVGGLLKIENSSIGPGAEVGIIFGSTTATIDMRYVTVAGNTLGMSCVEPYPNGTVRNSIIVSTAGNSFGGSFAGACLDALSFIDNAVDQADYGTQVGAYQASWFVDASERDFHLTAAGASEMDAIADWDSGDPTVDYDGDARPTALRAAPGMDEP